MKARIGALFVIGLAAIGTSYSWVHAQPPPAQEATRSVWDGVYTDAQAARGKDQFEQRCAKCHGDDLMGEDMTPPLSGGDFLANWNGLTVGDLFERIRTTMPLDKPGSLTREEEGDVVSYIFSFNKFPSGPTELPHDTPTLRGIVIQSMKPEGKGDKHGKGSN